MPKDKTDTHEKIIQAAKEEFMEKGFEQASMRSIAGKIGMSAAGLYRHFQDKEALFDALVEPALQVWYQWAGMRKAMDYEFLDENSLDKMWDGEGENGLIFNVVYPEFDAFKLLICRSEGTRHASFLHDMVMLQQKETMLFMEAARKKGLSVKPIKEEELHLLLTAYVGALFEVVVHDFPQEEARHYLKTFQAFFYPGWRKVLGL